MRLPLSLLLVSAGLSAMDTPQTVADVRVFGGWGNDGGEITTTYHEDGSSDIRLDPADADMSYRFGAGVFGSFGSIEGVGAPVLGASFIQTKSAADNREGPGGMMVTDPVDVTANVFSLHLGWAVAIGPNVHIEALAHAGYGTLKGTEHNLVLVDVDTGDVSVVDAHARADGNYWEVGGSFGLYYTFDCRAQIGVAVDAFHGEGDSTISSYEDKDGRNSFVGFSFDEEFEIDSVAGYISFGIRI